MPEQYIDVDTVTVLLESCLRRLADLAIEGYCERGSCMSSWHITPLSILKTELYGVRSDVDARSCTAKLQKTEIESLDSWGVWFRSYVPASRSRSLYYQVRRQMQEEVLKCELKDQPQKTAGIITALLPLWSVIRRIALIAAVNDKQPAAGNISFCLTGTKPERDQSDQIKSAAVHLVGDLKEARHQDSTSENTELLDHEYFVDINSMKEEWTSSSFKRRALRTAAAYFSDTGK